MITVAVNGLSSLGTSQHRFVGLTDLAGWTTMSNLMTELFYGKPEPVWEINSRRRNMGVAADPYYPTSVASRAYSSRGTSHMPDVTVKTPLYGMADVPELKMSCTLKVSTTWSAMLPSKR